MNSSEIAATIKGRRSELDLSQAELAQLAGCSKPFIIAAEAGKPSIRLDKLMALINVLGLSLRLEPRDGHG